MLPLIGNVIAKLSLNHGWLTIVEIQAGPCQHQCPIVLVHEAESVHKLMDWHNQASLKAARVQIDCPLPASHSKLAFALGARVDRHKVRALGLCWDKGDAGE